MGPSRASWPFLRPLVLAVAVLLAAGAAWGQTEWTKYEGNPVLQAGAPGEWDEGWVYTSAVRYDGTTYHMWYGGGGGTVSGAIGYATSPDGVTWTKYAGNPVLEPGDAGTWDAVVVLPAAILWDGATYHLWYLGTTSPDLSGVQQTGYATSPDGVTWTRHPANPVLRVGGAGMWDEGAAVITSVLAEGGTFRAWYLGFPPDMSYGAIGYATSLDGVTWSKRPEPVLGPQGPGWEGGGVYWPSVAGDGSVYHMWYAGWLTSPTIGHAVSTDGVHWARQPALEPVVANGGTGDFDAWGINNPRVLLVGDTAHMWYAGLSGANLWSLGYATAPLPFPEPPLLLNDGRFLVESMWWTADGRVGNGDPYPLTADSGAFTFFDPANIELLVKVLDGCAINQHYWVFVAGLTDVGVSLTVTDTETFETRTYNTTAGVPFVPIQDTDAFAPCE
jgi:predicted GH43/DUF377 family glycosyl hydrolase